MKVGDGTPPGSSAQAHGWQTLVEMTSTGSLEAEQAAADAVVAAILALGAPDTFADQVRRALRQAIDNGMARSDLARLGQHLVVRLLIFGQAPAAGTAAREGAGPGWGFFLVRRQEGEEVSATCDAVIELYLYQEGEQT